jgi:MFS transporter, DHA1 family, inner membrane transport protein
MTVGYAVFAADRTVLSAVLVPMAKTFGASSSETFFLQSAQFIGVFCFVFLAGHLSDKFGRWRVMTSGVLMFTIFTWLIGLATSYPEAFVFRLVSGFGEGIFWPVAMAWVASYFGRRKGLALGVFYVGFDAGSIGGLFIGGASFALFDAWQPAFFIAPSIGLIVLGAVPLLRRTGEQNYPRIRLGRDALELLRNRNVLLLISFAFFATWSSLWQSAFLPLYFNVVAGFSIPYSAFMTIPILAAGAAGKVILGGTSDRWRRNWLLFGISLVVILCYAIFFFMQNFDLDVVAALGMGFFSAAIFPILQALVVDTCGVTKAGTALGLTTSAQSLGAIFSATFTAALASLGVGRTLALNAMIPSAILIVLAIFLLEPRARKQEKMIGMNLR